MKPVDFPEANCRYGAPEGMDASQVQTISAYVSEITEGNLDGARVVVVAWKPSAEEIQDILHGQPVYLSCLGGLPPHFITTKLEEAIKL